MKNSIQKYSGILVTLTGAVLILLSAYYPSPFLQLEKLGISLTVLASGLILFLTGSILMAKYDEDFMEKTIGKIGKILELV